MSRQFFTWNQNLTSSVIQITFNRSKLTLIRYMLLKVISLRIFPTFKWAGKGELWAEGPVVLGDIVEDRGLAAILTGVGFFRAQISLMIFNVLSRE